MIKTNRDIQCIWDGTLAGYIVKNEAATTENTTKIIALHGLLDNLNSMLPLVEKLINRHPNYEFYLFDRAGHGFSSHIPKGFDYSNVHHLQDLRTVIQTLGWNKEKLLIIGHSFGGVLGLLYAATYPDDILCVVAMDALPKPETSSNNYYTLLGSRIDAHSKFHNTPPRNRNVKITMETAIELTKVTRPGLTDEAAKLLAQRLVRPDEANNLHFTRDEALNLSAKTKLNPFTEEMARSSVLAVKAFVLFIGTNNPQWERDEKQFDSYKEHNPNYEMTLIDGPHHFHMTHVDLVINRIEQYFNKHILQCL